MHIYIAYVALLLAASAVSAGASSVEFVPSDEIIVNPERGLYGHVSMERADFGRVRENGFSVCYADICLSDFLTAPISEERLEEIGRAFDRMKEAGVKAILRITYNNDPSGKDAAPEMMEVHLKQLQPVLKANSDLIAFFQAGMIGAWGEWHSSASRLDTPEGRKKVWSLLMKYLPAGKFIQIRTPGFVNELEALDAKPLTEKEAFRNTGRARISHHNDCWLADETDMGTYPPPGPEQEALKEQIALHTRYAPWGGETCRPNKIRAVRSVALAEGARFHATYLNSTYHPVVIRDLKADGCWDVIARSLGYRFELVNAVLPDRLKAGEEFSFSIELKNSGWAPVYNPRPVYLRLLAGSRVLKEYRLAGQDMRRWLPEKGPVRITGRLRAPASLRGSVSLALWLPDASPRLRSRPEYAVRLANEGVWDAEKGHNLLASGIPTE
ncbi:MAG: DUF4832 domain-containing protein [Armatimonadetes bacterium]|nr:DUF4832 domain-containing protein [Armatimonadota bacterium]